MVSHRVELDVYSDIMLDYTIVAPILEWNGMEWNGMELGGGKKVSSSLYASLIQCKNIH